KARLKNEVIKEGKICIECAMEQNIAGAKFCVIRVQDNGGGIHTEIANKVFEAFFTTKENGSGMGLAMAQMILDKMGGRILFVNEKEGVEFKIELPMQTEVGIKTSKEN
ncbi:ATP-binding protein, partial [Helicobacter rodentium]